MSAFRDVRKGPGDLPGDSKHPNSPDHDSSRAEWVSERADELAEARMADHDALTDAVEEVIGYSDWTDALASDMAAVMTESEASLETEAVRFFVNLYRRVKKDIRWEAEADAEAERDRWEDEQAEMRDSQRGDYP